MVLVIMLLMTYHTVHSIPLSFINSKQERLDERDAAISVNDASNNIQGSDSITSTKADTFLVNTGSSINAAASSISTLNEILSKNKETRMGSENVYDADEEWRQTTETYINEAAKVIDKKISPVSISIISNMKTLCEELEKNVSSATTINETSTQLHLLDEELDKQRNILQECLTLRLLPSLDSYDLTNSSDSTNGDVVKKLSFTIDKVRERIKDCAELLNKCNNVLEQLAQDGEDGKVVRWCKRQHHILQQDQAKRYSNISTSLQSSDNYSTPSNQTFEYILAAFAGLSGLLLLVLPPSRAYFPSVFCIFYGFGLIFYTVAFYGFDMTDMNSWSDDSWESTEFAVYGSAGLGGLIGALAPILLFPTHGMVVALIGGCFGVVFGIQTNNLGVYLLSNDPVYYTLSLAMGGGFILFGFIYSIIALVRKESGPRQCANDFAYCWVGSYLFIKMIGIFAGSYPNELTLSYLAAPVTQQIYLYMSFMFILAIFAFIIHWYCYRLSTLSRSSVPAGAFGTGGGAGGGTSININKVTTTAQNTPYSNPVNSQASSKGYISLHDDDRNSSKGKRKSQGNMLTGSKYAPVSSVRLGADGEPLFGGMRSGNDAEYFSKY